MKRIYVYIVMVICLLALAIPASMMGQQTPQATEIAVFSNVTTSPPTNQIIIKFTDNDLATAQLAEAEAGLMSQLSQAAGVSVTYVRPMSGEAHVLGLPQALPVKEVAQMAAEMEKVAGVAYAEPDLIKTIDGRAHYTLLAPHLSPDDAQFANQWHYVYTANTSEGLNLAPAWEITTGSASTVVAVIDTGILAHNDLAGKTVPGYDFIGVYPLTNVEEANDGDGRDNNPTDPGDWITTNECGFAHEAQDSSWHGTHVAGTIGAATNNNLGVAGVNWNAKILPVRVLGKCGGYTSDIVDGMRWAAGLSVTGVPANANPAKVLNLSLGGPGACSATEQAAVNAIVAAGSTIVVAAGNSIDDASNYTPASCNGVITVASTNRTGDRAFYSNFGSVVEVSGPGGETDISANGVLSTLDSGLTGPANDHAYAYYQGTSMAAPHIAGVASLIVGLRPAYTSAQVSTLLRLFARDFPAGSSCTTSNCGAGIVDAHQVLTNIDNIPDIAIYLPVVLKPAAAPPPPPPTNPISNPGFESGPTGWTEFSAQGYSLILNSGFPGGVTPHGGSWAVWLGGADYEISYIQQQVTVPTSTPYLAYWHWIASADDCGWDFGYVVVNGTVVHEYDLCSALDTYGWVLHTVNLAAYAGQSVALQIRVETDSSLNSNLFVDDVSFQASAVSENAPAVPIFGADTAVPKQR